MRYPVGVISFLTDQLTVFSRLQAVVIFRRLVFSELLRWSFRESKVSLVYYKMETSWSRFVEITDEEMVEFVEEQENTNTKRKNSVRRIQDFFFHSGIKP